MTFRKEVLQYLGIQPGEKIELICCRTVEACSKRRPAGSIGSFVGLLAGRSNNTATIDEINEARRAVGPVRSEGRC